MNGSKLLHLLAGTAALLAVALPANAAAQHRVLLEARAGAAVPAGELAELEDPGASLGGGAAVYLHPRVALRVDFDASFLQGDKRLESGAFSPGIHIFHTTAGIETVLASPRLGNVPVTVSANAGAGSARFDVKAFAVPFDRPQQGGQTFRFTERYLTANAGVKVGYPINRNLDLVLSGQGYATFTDEEDTALLELLSDEIQRFDRAWSFPVTVGVRAGL